MRQLNSGGPRTPRGTLRTEGYRVRRRRAKASDIRGVSEVLGTILMVSISVTLVGIVSLWMNTIPTVEDEPRVNLQAQYMQGNLSVHHMGGEILHEEDTSFVIRINGALRYDLNISDGMGGQEYFGLGEEWRHPIRLADGSLPASTDIIDVVITERSTNSLLLKEVVQEGPDLSDVPDLSVSADEITFKFRGTSLDKGEKATITAKVRNLGGQDSGAIVVRFFAEGAFIPPKCTVPNIAAGGDADVQVNWRPAYHGLMNVKVKAMPLDTELVYTNNVASTVVEVEPTVTIIHGPDLVVADEDILLGDDAPRHGANVTVTVVVHNTGDQYVNNTRVRLYDSVDGLLFDRSGLSVGAGGQAQFSTTWLARPGGVHTLTAVVDPLDVVDEISEINNNASRDILVLPTVLVVDDDGAGTGDEADSSSVLRDSLTASGIPYDLCVVEDGRDGPGYTISSTPLEDYDIVIWNTGYEGAHTLRPSDLDALEDFLSDGGYLWLMGQDILQDVDDTPDGLLFISDVLHVELGGTTYDEGTPTILEGVDGDPVTDSLRLSMGDIPPGYDGGDDIQPSAAAGAVGILGNSTQGVDDIALRYRDNGTGSKLVLFTFPFDGISGAGQRAVVTYRVLNWFNYSLVMSDDLAACSMDFSLDTPEYMDTVTITATVRNNGPAAVNTTVAFMVGEEYLPTYPDMKINPCPVSLSPGGTATVTKQWIASSLGMYQFSVVVDPYNLIDEINERNNDMSYSTIAVTELEVLSAVLLVDDDGSANNGGTHHNTTENVSAALNYLGYNYDMVIVAPGADGPNVTFLKHYNIVVWSLGEEGDDMGDTTLSAADQENLTTYLDAGYPEAEYLPDLHVNLWIIGQGLLNDLTGGVGGVIPAGDFARTHLMVDSCTLDAGTPDPLVGRPTDEISHGFDLGIDSEFTDEGDTVVPESGAEGLFEAGGAFTGLSYEGSSYSAVLMPFEYSFIEGDSVTRSRGTGPRSGVDASGPPGASSREGSRATLLSDDFESGVGGWTHGGTNDQWELGVPAYNDIGYDISEDHTSGAGVNCWGTDLDSSADAGAGNSYWLHSPSVFLPATGTSTLRYWLWYDLNLAAQDDDAWVSISDDGGSSWTQMDPPPGYSGWADDPSDGGGSQSPSYEGDTGGAWKYAAADVTAYAGNTVIFNWTYLDADADATSHAGIYIDDVSVINTPPNNAPVLTDGGVTPDTGNTTTTFTYTVRYTDADDDPPVAARVYIDGTPYDMTSPDTNYIAGAIYRYSTPLSVGAHAYYFSFSDGQAVDRSPDSGNNTGPSVVYAAGGGPGTDSRITEVAYMVLHYFDQPETRKELKVSAVDLDLSDGNPILGDSYVVRTEVFNVGGTGASTVVRFYDGNTVINSVNVYVEADDGATAEVVWTPLFAGDRRITVSVDPQNTVTEIFKCNNEAGAGTRVYYFYDDMENGTCKWTHESTILRINGESNLDFIDSDTVYSNILSDWENNIGFIQDTTTYHSRNSSYMMEEPVGGDGGGGGGTPYRYEFFLPDDGEPGFYAVGIRESSVFDVYQADDSGDWQSLYASQTIDIGQIVRYPDLTPYYLYRVDSSGPLLIVKTSKEGSNCNIANFDDGSEKGKNFGTLGGKIVVIALEPNTDVTIRNYADIPDYNTAVSGGVDNWAAKTDVNFGPTAVEGTYEVWTQGNSVTPHWITATKDVLAIRCSGDMDELDTAISTDGASLGQVLYYPYIKDNHPPRIIVYNTGSSSTTVRLSEITASHHIPPTGAQVTVKDNWVIPAFGMDTYGWNAPDPGVSVPGDNADARIFKVEIIGGDTTGLKVVSGGVSGGKDDFDVTGDDGSSDDSYDLFGFWDSQGDWRVLTPLIVGGNGHETLEKRSQHFILAGASEISVTSAVGNVPVPFLDNSLTTNVFTYFSTMETVLTYDTIGDVTNVVVAGVPGATVDTGSKTITLPKGRHSTAGSGLTVQGTGSGSWYIGIRVFSFADGGSFAWQIKNVAEWDGVDYSLVTFTGADVGPGCFKFNWTYKSDDAFILIIDGKGNCWIHTILPYEGSISSVGEVALLRSSGRGDTETAAAVPASRGSRAPSNATLQYLVTPTFSLENESSAKLRFYQKYYLVQSSNGGLLQVGTDDDDDGVYKYRYLQPTHPYPNNLYLDETEYDDFGNEMRWCWNGFSGKGRFTWDYTEADLSDYVGNDKVRVKFVCFIYGGGTGGGWWIDDVEVTTTRADSMTPAAGMSDLWAITTSQSYRGNYSWGLMDPGTGYMPAGIDSFIATQPIDLSNALNATLSAQFKFNINASSGLPPDGFRVEATEDNGVTWKALSLGVRCAWGLSGSESDTYGGGKADGKSCTGISAAGDGWVEAGTLTRLLCDLSGWIGEVIHLRIRVVTASDDNPHFGSTHYEDPGASYFGFYVDDFIVHGVSIQGEVS